MRHVMQSKRLRDAGFRLTSPREIIINLLKKTRKHLSAEEIYLDAVRIKRSIGLTTVYRTLELLTQIDMVRKHDFGDGRVRYELTQNPFKEEHHHHLVCLKCKKIIDYIDFVSEEKKIMQKTEKELSQKHQFKIYHHTVNFYGLCNKCQSKS